MGQCAHKSIEQSWSCFTVFLCMQIKGKEIKKNERVSRSATGKQQQHALLPELTNLTLLLFRHTPSLPPLWLRVCYDLLIASCSCVCARESLSFSLFSFFFYLFSLIFTYSSCITAKAPKSKESH